MPVPASRSPMPSSWSWPTTEAPGGTHNEFEADAEGRFRANPLSADRYEVSAAAPEGQPYLTVSKLFNWPKGAVEYPIDLALPRGVVIRGKVTEEGSGKPVAGARITSGAQSGGGRPVVHPEWPRSEWPGWLVSDLGRAQPGLFCRPGPERRLCTRSDRPVDAFAGKARWPPRLRPRLPRLRPQAN